MSNFAITKVTDLSTRSIFTTNVVRHFLLHEEYWCLRRLAIKLYIALFENDKLSCLYKGTTLCDSYWNESLVTKAQEEVEKARSISEALSLDHNRGWGTTDPFERRLLFAQKISEEFLKIIQKARSEANKQSEIGEEADDTDGSDDTEQPGPAEQPAAVEQLEAPEQPVSIELPRGTQGSENTDDWEIVDEPKGSVFKKFSRKMHLGTAKQKVKRFGQRIIHGRQTRRGRQ